MHPLRILLPFTLAIIIVPSAALLAAAAAPQQDAQWREETRDLSFELLPDGFRADSTRTSDIGNDELRAQYFLDEGRLRLRYVSDEPGNETVMTMDLSFLSLVEFRDTTGDGRYGFGDQVVQRIQVEDMEGASVASEPFLSDGRMATASYSFPNRSADGNDSVLPVGNNSNPSILPGSFDLRFYMVPSTVMFEGSKVTPLDIKFDIEVNRFPYQEAGTRMALETRFSANNPVQEATWSERLLETQDGFFRGFFSWERTADVDGTPRPVGMSALSYGSSTTAEDSGVSSIGLAFAYPRGDTVVHDPTLGVMRTQGIVEDVVQRLIQGDWLLYSLGLSVALVAVGVPAAVRLRER